MTSAQDLALAPSRLATRREYAMTRPDHFAVRYSINPWMDPARPVDVPRALAQWQRLYDRLVDLGHTVALVPSLPGLPDMVYAANGGFVVDGFAYGVRFAHPERSEEAPAYDKWLDSMGLSVIEPHFVNEGEGDFLVCGRRILAGHGFRTDIRAHGEVAALTGREVVSLELVDPRYYHLDTALAVVSEDVVAYHPPAFSPAAQDRLANLFPDALVVGADDAALLGLNVISDGRHVVLAEGAQRFAAQLRERGFEPIGVDLSELLKGGGGPKCCVLELRR